MELRLGLELGDRRVVEKIRKQNNRYAFVSFNIGHALLKNKDDQWVISYESNDFTYIEWLYTALSSWIIDESYLKCAEV